MTELRVIPLEGMPEVQEGADLGALVAAAVRLEDGDVVVIAQKAVSKAEGRVVRLDEVEPAHDCPGHAGGLPHHELGRAGDLVRDRDLRRAELVPDAVAVSAQVEERPDAGDADRDVRRSLAPRPSERVRDHDADRAPGQLAQTVAEALRRGIRVEGAVERLPAAASDAYFASRPRRSRLSALASRQSEGVAGRDVLDHRVAELAAELGDAEPERPDWWGGYLLVPDSFELWQHRDDRLHDRLRYRRDGAGWTIERLSP